MAKASCKGDGLFSPHAAAGGCGVHILERVLEEVIASNLCETNIYRSLVSPNGRAAAVVFQVDCGATSRFNRQMSVTPEAPAFSAQRYPPFLVISGEQNPSVRWLSDHAIEVTLPRGIDVFKRGQRSNGV
jgi:hypothetical protein